MLVKVSNKELADEIYLRIKERESKFEDIAYEFSEGNEKYSLGKIGPISINKIESLDDSFRIFSHFKKD